MRLESVTFEAVKAAIIDQCPWVTEVFECENRKVIIIEKGTKKYGTEERYGVADRELSLLYAMVGSDTPVDKALQLRFFGEVLYKGEK